MSDITETSLAIRVPATAEQAAEMQALAESDAAAIATVVVDTPDRYAFADALLRETVQRKDAILAMRTSATGPLYQVIRTIEGWFRPAVQALEASERHLKGGIGRYRVALEAREREARALAAAAVQTGDADTMIDALNTAAAAAVAPAGRATAALAWVPTAADAATVPREYMCVDWDKLRAAGKAAGNGPAPTIPGVAFERQAAVRARR